MKKNVSTLLKEVNTLYGVNVDENPSLENRALTPKKPVGRGDC
jgi:hypothetical protein